MYKENVEFNFRERKEAVNSINANEDEMDDEREEIGIDREAIKEEFLELSKQFIGGNVEILEQISDKITEIPFFIARELIPIKLIDSISKKLLDNSIPDELIPHSIIVFAYATKPDLRAFNDIFKAPLIVRILTIAAQNPELQKYALLGFSNLIKTRPYKYCEAMLESNFTEFLALVIDNNPSLPNLHLCVSIIKSVTLNANDELMKQILGITEKLLGVECYPIICKLLLVISNRSTIASMLDAFLGSDLYKIIFSIIVHHCESLKAGDEGPNLSILLAALSCITAIFDHDDPAPILRIIEQGLVVPITHVLTCDNADLQWIAGTILDRTLMCNENACREIITPDLIGSIIEDAEEGHFETRQVAVRFICSFIGCCTKDELEPISFDFVEALLGFLEAAKPETVRPIINALMRILQIIEGAKEFMLDKEVIDTLENIKDGLNESDVSACDAFISLLTEGDEDDD